MAVENRCRGDESAGGIPQNAVWKKGLPLVHLECARVVFELHQSHGDANIDKSSRK
jgi:hypothetical protein